MEILENIVSHTKYNQVRKRLENFKDRIVTNVGVFYDNYDIPTDDYKKITCMKVYGKIMEKIKFGSFINLEILDVSSMEFIKQLNPFVNILNKQMGLEEEKVPDTELLQLNSLTNLRILKFTVKTSQEIMGSGRVKGDYSFLNFLPPNVNTLIVVGLSNSLVDELNFSNIPATINRIELYKQPINKSNSLNKIVKEQLEKYKYPFGCKIYLDNVEIEL